MVKGLVEPAARLLFLLRIIVANAAFCRCLSLFVTVYTDFHSNHIFLNGLISMDQLFVTVHAFERIVFHFMVSGRQFDIRSRCRRAMLGMTIDAVGVRNAVPELDCGRAKNRVDHDIAEEGDLAPELTDNPGTAVAQDTVNIRVGRLGPCIVVRLFDVT